MPKLNITQASVTAALLATIGQVVAFVPSLGPDKQNLISAGSFVIAAIFALVHALPFHGAAKTPPKDPQAEKMAKAAENLRAALQSAQAAAQTPAAPSPPVTAPPPGVVPS